MRDNDAIFGYPADGLAHIKVLFKFHRRRIRVPKERHRPGIADHQQIEADIVSDGRKRRIVDADRSDPFSPSLLLAQ